MMEDSVSEVIETRVQEERDKKEGGTQKSLSVSHQGVDKGVQRG